MYDYEYEEDVLLTLRLLKYLQEENPDRAQDAVAVFKTLAPEDPYEFIEYTFCDIFTDITFDSDEAEELTIATFSHPGIDRFYALLARLELIEGQQTGASRKKVHDIVEFFLCGATYSVFQFSVQVVDASVTINLQLSPDCYDPLPFFNSFIDMLLYFQQESQRLEELIRQKEQETDNLPREEAA